MVSTGAMTILKEKDNAKKNHEESAKLFKKIKFIFMAFILEKVRCWI
tara:strand:- start:3285 stop:3425 length:141 start_codon:yes stop_codon:yes gene_type:complete